MFDIVLEFSLSWLKLFLPFQLFFKESAYFFNYEVFSEKLIVKKFEEIPTILRYYLKKYCMYYNGIAILL